jgi:hypothetical protein
MSDWNYPEDYEPQSNYRPYVPDKYDPQNFPMKEDNWRRGDFTIAGRHYACVIRKDSTKEQVEWINFEVFKAALDALNSSNSSETLEGVKSNCCGAPVRKYYDPSRPSKSDVFRCAKCDKECDFEDIKEPNQ